MAAVTDLIQTGIFKKEILLKRNDFLKIQNTIDTKLYYVLEGSLKISVFHNDHEQIIRFGYDQNLIVALDSFISEKPSPLFIQAIKKTKVKIAEKSDFIAWVNASVDNKEQYIQILEQLVLQQMDREYDLLIDTPQERYNILYHRNPLLFQYIPNKHIANYLKMTPETLSRLKKP